MAVRAKDAQQIIGTVRNQLGAAEGSLLPPKQVGQFRVPLVTNLKVSKTQSFVGGTQFTLTFDDPYVNSGLSNPIDHYNIYVGGLAGNTNNLNGPNTCLTSPAIVRVTTSQAQNVVFYVQTALKNGLLSNLSASPTCTGATIAATINTTDIPNGSITLAQLANETPGALITFDNSGVPTLINPVAATQFLVSNGSATHPVYSTPATLGLVTDAFKATADKTLTNTVTETSIVPTGSGSMTLAANSLGVGTTVRIKGWGYIVSDGTTTLNIKLKYGSTLLGTTGVVSAPFTGQAGIQFDAMFTCRTTGASGSVAAQGMFNNIGFFPLINTSPVTIDTTASTLVDVTATWGAASTGDSITITNLTLEVLN